MAWARCAAAGGWKMSALGGARDNWKAVHASGKAEVVVPRGTNMRLMCSPDMVGRIVHLHTVFWCPQRRLYEP